MRGFCGIGVFNPKHEVNIGTLFRSAVCFGANYLFTVGRRYKRQSSDTPDSLGHLPCFNHVCFEDLLKSLPARTRLVLVENSPEAIPIERFTHPPQAVYLLGAEDHGLPPRILQHKGALTVKINTKYCLNVSVAGSIILFDRQQKCGSPFLSEPAIANYKPSPGPNKLPLASKNVVMPAGPLLTSS